MKISLAMGFVVIRVDLVIRFGKKSTSQFPKYWRQGFKFFLLPLEAKREHGTRAIQKLYQEEQFHTPLWTKLLQALPVSSFNDHLINYD